MAPIVRCSSHSTRSLVVYGLRRGSSCTVSVSRTVPSPSTWMPPPSFTRGEGRCSAPASSATVLGDAVVALPRRPRVRAPPVEGPVDRAERAAVVDHEGRADVAHPVVVQRRLDELDLARQALARLGDGRRVDDHRDRLEPGRRVRDRGPGVAGLVGGCRVVAEGVADAGEGHPDALLRSELGGHGPGHRVLLTGSPRRRRCSHPAAVRVRVRILVALRRDSIDQAINRAEGTYTGGVMSSTSMKVRTRKSPAERSAEILAAATVLAREQGLSALTLRAVAERAGVASGLHRPLPAVDGRPRRHASTAISSAREIARSRRTARGPHPIARGRGWRRSSATLLGRHAAKTSPSCGSRRGRSAGATPPLARGRARADGRVAPHGRRRHRRRMRERRLHDAEPVGCRVAAARHDRRPERAVPRPRHRWRGVRREDGRVPPRSCSGAGALTARSIDAPLIVRAARGSDPRQRVSE